MRYSTSYSCWQQQHSEGSNADCLSAAVLHNSHAGYCAVDLIYRKSMSVKRIGQSGWLFSVLIIGHLWMFVFTVCTESKKRNSPCGGFNAAFSTGRWLSCELWFALLDISVTWVLPHPLTCSNKSTWPRHGAQRPGFNQNNLTSIQPRLFLSRFWLSAPRKEIKHISQGCIAILPSSKVAMATKIMPCDRMLWDVCLRRWF